MRTSGLPTAQEVFQFAQTVEHDAWDNTAQQNELKDHISRLTRDPGSPTIALPSSSGAVPKPKAMAGEERRYTILKLPEEPTHKPRYPTSPPKIHSAKELAGRKTDFSMYDAVLDRPATSPMDKEVESFLPMLNDYLKLQDLPAPTADASTSDSGDYVYDIFYRRVGGFNPAEYTGNVATLTGLPTSGDDSDYSDDEVEDEADEDSNDEGFYRNDYPDEEDSDSDELHHYSDSSEEFVYGDDGSDHHNWR